MLYCHPFLNQSLFDPTRLVHRNPETVNPTTEREYANVRESLDILDESEDAEMLRSALLELIDSKFPEYTERLADRPVGLLIEAFCELYGWDVGDKGPAMLVRNIIKIAFDHKYPHGNQSARGVLDRVEGVLKMRRKPRRSVKREGSELISKSRELVSPRLKELRSKLRDLGAEYDKYVVVTNKATIKLIRHEIILRKLLEDQGFKYDRKGEAKNFYYFTSKYSVFLDDNAPKMPQGKRSAAKKAASAWKSLGHHFDRSNKEVNRLGKRKEKVEADIRTEERKLKRNS